MSTEAVIDADSIVYKAGFAVETTVYEVVAEDEDGFLHQLAFDDAVKGSEFLRDNGLVSTGPATVTREAEPIQNALQIVKTKLEEILDETHAGSYTVYLSGPDNFRDDIATIKPYKGNRKEAHKPLHYDAIRAYLIEHWEAVVSDNCEADDLCSINWYHVDYRTVTVGIDKDLDQIPGFHYNFQTRTHYEVHPTVAEYNFWLQVLTGDSSDNVGGVWRMGDAKAAEWLDSYDGDPWDAILVAYYDSQSKRGCPYKLMPFRDAAVENAQLVYLQQAPDELWLPGGNRGKVSNVPN